ncbi:MAG TPA: TlpA disulfide reductase family protein, partial [Burkholderiaceae bacterium]|nr:TlpA disulfide reductase family protein [Burkholderiaceae bacterium]
PGRRRVLAASLASIAAWAGAGWPRPAQAAHVVRPWPDGKPAPALGLADLDGKAWSLSALKGQVVALNFWASWCEPCRAEMPSLELLAAKHERDGLTILAVNYKESLPTVRRFLEALPFSLPILLDRDGNATGEWTPRVFPTTVLIDRGGVPRLSVLGELEWNGPVAHDLVAPLLAARAKSA